MLSRKFHNQIRSEIPNIPKDRENWPKGWSIISFKEYPRFEKVELPKQMLRLDNLENVLIGRHSSKEFSPKELLSKKELSTLLYYSAGIKRPREKEVTDTNKTRRFYPSGGARYPLEMYLLVQGREVAVNKGLYHYNVLEHSLETILKEDCISSVQEAVGSKWTKEAEVVFIITALQERNSIKYDDFGYDMLATEAGHMSQNLHLVAESLNKKYCPIFGFNEKKIQDLLYLDEGEIILYMTVLG
jgi:SagB-type dehydrogenase family enzyme